MIRNHGMVPRYDTRIPGLNLRLPEISAAIATVQDGKASRLPKVKKEKRKTPIRHDIRSQNHPSMREKGSRCQLVPIHHICPGPQPAFKAAQLCWNRCCIILSHTSHKPTVPIRCPSSQHGTGRIVRAFPAGSSASHRKGHQVYCRHPA